MIDDKTVIMATAKNRTLANLQENPSAAYMIMEPGEGIFDWKGIRVYLKRKECATSGETFDTIKGQAAKFVGEEAAKMMYAAVILEVVDVRPIINIEQGWEKSI
jgi:hypothetical protein